jgi:hypothetical protein
MASEQDKCRETKVIRVDGSDGSWIDLEVLENASFKGAQWQGPDVGNQAQETIYIFRRSENDDRGGDASVVGLIPIPDRKEGSHQATIHNLHSALFETRKGRVRLEMANKKENCNRNKKDRRRRIQFNQIDEEFLVNGRPPSGRDYKDAVEKSKDTSEIWLDVLMPKEVVFYRGKDIRHQKSLFQDVWGGKVNLPGGGTETNKKADHVRLDPFQVVVNFGPDGLAVEFFDGET